MDIGKQCRARSDWTENRVVSSFLCLIWVQLVCKDYQQTTLVDGVKTSRQSLVPCKQCRSRPDATDCRSDKDLRLNTKIFEANVHIKSDYSIRLSLMRLIKLKNIIQISMYLMVIKQLILPPQANHQALQTR